MLIIAIIRFKHSTNFIFMLKCVQFIFFKLLKLINYYHITSCPSLVTCILIFNFILNEFITIFLNCWHFVEQHFNIVLLLLAHDILCINWLSAFYYLLFIYLYMISLCIRLMWIFIDRFPLYFRTEFWFSFKSKNHNFWSLRLKFIVVPHHVNSRAWVTTEFGPKSWIIVKGDMYCIKINKKMSYSLVGPTWMNKNLSHRIGQWIKFFLNGPSITRTPDVHPSILQNYCIFHPDTVSGDTLIAKFS